MRQVGIVLIGRNEGQRLIDCLESLIPLHLPMIYVDSGSTDGSQSKAHDLGARVIELDLSLPFTAARARNTGFAQLGQNHPGIEFVQFLDGDCTLQAGWLTAALPYLEADSELAVVCGRRRERFPEASPFNLLCDIEWDTPVGPALACGGDALMRRTAFEEVGGFNDALIAGEEPELCMRLRKAGWQIRRIDAEMSLHDAAMHRFSQWFKRARRAGHAYAEGAWLHRADGMWRREVRSIGLWGVLLPGLALLLVPFSHGFGLLLLLAYPALVVKISWAYRRKYGLRKSILYALACVSAKFPQVLGMSVYHLNRVSGKRAKLMEYKEPAARCRS